MYDDVVAFIRETFGTDGKIPLHEPRFRGNEKAYVADAIDSTFVSSVGEYVARFERAVADYVGCGHAVATVNGTAAL
ncbi:MAG TPA: DegT/DnrJ/EryC1/StrS family aminotransferase, partial [Alphaproteobacteria bacterium]|nr:DegT/DnrJ/EryC1/StrS family aminotransferase [Alphaproteobacteria bacterium]